MKVCKIPMEQLRTALGEQLERGEALLPVTGDSMWPLFAGGRDTVLLERSGRGPRRGDIALYRRADGSHVLHRIIRTEPGACVCCGDSQWVPETVPQERILAYVTSFCRKGRWYQTEICRGYRLYAGLWTRSLPLRRPLLGLLRLARKLRGQRHAR